MQTLGLELGAGNRRNSNRYVLKTLLYALRVDYDLLEGRIVTAGS